MAAAAQRPVGVGIVGLGRSGWGIHAKALRTMTDRYRVVAVTDPLQDRAREAAEDLGATAHADLEALLADDAVELVVVASPNGYHATQVQAALRAGKHALCEKPFGLTTADVDAMIAAARKADRVLQPFQQRRYEPDFRKVKEVCESGLLGEIVMIRIAWHGFKRRWDWQTLTETDGGALNNNGPHPIDHALELFGDAEPEIAAERMRCLCSGDAEDHVKIVMTGAGRPRVEIELTDVVAFGQDRWLVCGTAGGLRGNANELEWKWVDWSAMPERPVDARPTPDRSYNSESLPWQHDTWKPAAKADAGSGAAPASQPVLDLYTDLYRTVREGAPQVITPESVRRRVAVIEQVRQAAPVVDIVAAPAAV